MATQRGDPNAAQLRSKIDKGKTGEKVPASDPAAAPFGTDDEAAGIGSDRAVDSGTVGRQEQVAASLNANHPPIAADSRDLRDDAGQKPFIVWAMLLALACIAALVIAAALLA